MPDPDLMPALAEAVQIAFGYAAGPLSELLDAHIVLKPPQVESFPLAEIPNQISGILTPDARIHLVSQAFRSELRGECWLALRPTGRHSISRLFGFDGSAGEESLDGASEHQGLLEVANIVIGACISRLASILDTYASFSPPVLHLWNAPCRQVATLLDSPYDQTILVRTVLAVDKLDALDGVLLILLPTGSLAWLSLALRQFSERVS